MIVNEETKILQLIKEYPFLTEFLIKYNEKFSMLSNPIMRNTMGRVATLKMAAEIAGIDINKFVEDIKREIEKRGGSSKIENRDDSKKQEILKSIIKDLHNGVPFVDVKKRFDELIKDLDAAEIARMEEALISEGMPVEEVMKLCDLHVNVFKGILDQKPSVEVPPDHPIYTYQRENKAIVEHLNNIQNLMINLDKNQSEDIWASITYAIKRLQDINYHYLRKENQLFPYLEKHDFSGPSQVMWGIHDEIRNKIKECIRLTEEKKWEELKKILPSLIVKINEMIYKEENILFPTAIKLITESEWQEIRSGEKEIGFSFIDYHDNIKQDKLNSHISYNGELSISTGSLTIEQVDAILKTLPLDISFVDENDKVKYYSDTKDRIFPRSPGVIGRDVRKCHPLKSVHIVEKILKSFKEGKKNVAEFYIVVGGRDIHIRYFAVRNKYGKYLGTLEVSQDVTAIKKLTKEKRLLDWED